ncbi:MAG: ribonuclease HII [Alphaproteobacteria bacterium]|nr:ribonuclease HII [Alphaproteobacteria bacterium]
MAKRDSIHPDFSLEEAALARGFGRVAGVDEAGRGPWAGPVVAAAVVLDPSCIPVGLNDSKKLTESKRESLFDEIMNCADVGVGIADVERIDQHNILRATLWAMGEAIAGLAAPADYGLIDGNRRPDLKCQCETVVKGDGRSLSIAAASIIAKVTRDRIMIGLAAEFPAYGFERHKGYGTALHQQALAEAGPCLHHRKSFAPIRVLLEATAA